MNTQSSLLSAPPELVGTVEPPWPRRRYAWQVVAVLTAAYTLSFIDRQVLGLVLEPIRRDLLLSDTQVSLLAGTAFAIFYVTLGLPLGRIADRANRRNLIIGGVLLWSLMTAACGLADNFWELFATRVGVGVGEAALSPAALSIISDYFPPQQRVRPLAMYFLAPAIGSGLAYLLGGTVSAAASASPDLHLPLLGPLAAWQLVFIIIGTPGMAFALVILSIREPVRRGVRGATSGTGHSVPVARTRDIVHFIARENPQTFAVLFLAYAGFALHADSVFVWIPTLFIRRFGWSPAEIGLIMGSVVLVCATLGVLASMSIAARLQARGSVDAVLRTSLLMGAALTPLGILLPLVNSPGAALAVLAPVSALSFGLFAMIAPTLQLITPNQMRGQVSAVFSVFNNVIGTMIGATSVALLTDYVFHDPLRLHHSLVVVAALTLPLSSALMWWGLPHFSRSIVRAEGWMGEVARGHAQSGASTSK
jgi:MFS family permease